MPFVKYDREKINCEYGESIEKEYISRASAKDLAKKYLCDCRRYDVIFDILKMRNVEKRSLSNVHKVISRTNSNPCLNGRKYSVNHDYFKAWSHNMAYLLGYLATDGAITRDKHAIKFGLSSVDVDLLYKIKEELQYTGPIRHKEAYLKATDKTYQVDEMVIYSFKMVEDLINLGITPNKSLTLNSFDFIPQEYQKSFILGVFDGDGSIGKIGGERCDNSMQIRIRVCSASYEFIKSVRDMMSNNGFTHVKIHKAQKNRQNVQYNLEYSTKDAINYLSCYENVSIYLNRKLEKLVELIEMRQEYESLLENKNILKIKTSELIKEYNISKSPQQPCSIKVEKVRQTETEQTV